MLHLFLLLDFWAGSQIASWTIITRFESLRGDREVVLATTAEDGSAQVGIGRGAGRSRRR